MAEWQRGNEWDRERERERERWGRPEGERGRERGREDDRGYVARGTDEVRSWFGDDEAERRRRMDEQRDASRGSTSAWEGGGRTGHEGHWGDRGQEYGRGQYDARRGTWRGSDQGRWDESRGGSEQSGASGVWNTGSQWRDESRWNQGRERPGASSVSYTEVWMIPGPFTGHGPRGYQRRDERIMDDVCERLTHHGHVDARNIEVQVTGGEVTLRGSVDSRDAKRHAEDIAEAVSGVREVHNELRVTRPSGDTLAGRGAGITGATAGNLSGTDTTRDRRHDRDGQHATPEDRPTGSDAPEVQARAGLGNTPESGQDNPDSILGLSPTAGGTTQGGTTPGTAAAPSTPADASRRNRSTT